MFHALLMDGRGGVNIQLTSTHMVVPPSGPLVPHHCEELTDLFFGVTKLFQVQSTRLRQAASGKSERHF